MQRLSMSSLQIGALCSCVSVAEAMPDGFRGQIREAGVNSARQWGKRGGDRRFQFHPKLSTGYTEKGS